MADWWKRIFGKRGKGDPGERPVAREGAAAPAKATWLAADDPGNPFGVELLDLMVTQQLVATSSDRAVAERAMSWGTSTGAELDIAPALDRPAVDCEIRLPIDRALPDGLLFSPRSMDEKWVIAWRQGRIIAARAGRQPWTPSPTRGSTERRS